MGFQPLRPVKKVLSLGVGAVNTGCGVCIGTVKAVGQGTIQLVGFVATTSINSVKLAGKGSVIIVRAVGLTAVRMYVAALLHCMRILGRMVLSTVRRTGGFTVQLLLHLSKPALWPALAYGLARAVAREDKSLGPTAASVAAVEYGIYSLARSRRQSLKLVEEDPPQDKEMIFSDTKGERLNGSGQESMVLDEDEMAALIFNAWSNGDAEDEEYEDVEDEADQWHSLLAAWAWGSKGVTEGKDRCFAQDTSQESHPDEKVAGYNHREASYSSKDVKAENGQSVNGLVEDTQGKAAPKERVLFYSTSMRAVRKTFDACNSIRNILEGYGLAVDERDISMHAEFKEELRSLVGGPLVVPSVFINGRRVGGFEELQKLNEEGKLKDILKGLRRTSSGYKCIACGNLRFCVCTTCDGSNKIWMDDEVQTCPDCNERGLQRCSACA